ncbi:hypothetical protein F3J20_30220 [Paraburkholderia sp. Cy-641]|uniref:hypothetical protein n=1 Tax=Paraburkholderia sp. Cy-641 TaxID=2608337 RepID=UPI00141F742C|nr:hypothetical protein [Paraburkholderia sp. Cy-641]NIF81597.1 hypothetical protein [Paraburkholderia sp. Cy-641]
MSYSDAEYIACDPFDGERDVNIKLRTVKIVRVRKPQPCFGGADPRHGDQHVIQPGERARYERALIDSDYWGRYYHCLTCLDKWIAEINGEEE